MGDSTTGGEHRQSGVGKLTEFLGHEGAIWNAATTGMTGNIQRVLLGSGFNVRTVTTKASVGAEKGSLVDCGVCEVAWTNVELSSDPRNSVASRTRSPHQNQLTYFLHNELININQN